MTIGTSYRCCYQLILLVICSFITSSAGGNDIQTCVDNTQGQATDLGSATVTVEIACNEETDDVNSVSISWKIYDPKLSVDTSIIGYLCSSNPQDFSDPSLYTTINSLSTKFSTTTTASNCSVKGCIRERIHRNEYTWNNANNASCYFNISDQGPDSFSSSQPVILSSTPSFSFSTPSFSSSTPTFPAPLFLSSTPTFPDSTPSFPFSFIQSHTSTTIPSTSTSSAFQSLTIKSNTLAVPSYTTTPVSVDGSNSLTIIGFVGYGFFVLAFVLFVTVLVIILIHLRRNRKQISFELQPLPEKARGNGEEIHL